MADEHQDPDDLDRPPSFFPYGAGSPDGGSAYGEPTEVTIEGVFMSETNNQIQRFVLLSDGERKLPILIGGYEAQAISLPLEGTRPDRPMSHDLMKNLLDRLEATLDRVVIDDLWNSVYYAKLFIKWGNQETTIDARPSDAIALAVRADAPIFVADGIMEMANE